MLLVSTESNSATSDSISSPTKSSSSISSTISKLFRYKSSSSSNKSLPESSTFTPYSWTNQMQISYPSLTHSSLLVYNELNPPDSEGGYREQYDESCDTSLVGSSGHCTPFDNRSETNSSDEACEDGGNEKEGDNEGEVLYENNGIESVVEEVSRWSNTDSRSHESSNDFEHRGEKVSSIVKEEPFEFEGI